MKQIVQTQAEIVRRAFSVRTPIIPIESGLHESKPDGTVRINWKALRESFREVPANVLPYLARWLVAHEYWHQVQFRERGPEILRLDDDTTRVFECEADLMASYVVLTDAMATTQDSQIPDYIAGAASALSANSGEAGTHPTLDQRAMAGVFGFLKAQYEEARKSNDAGTAALAESVRSVIDLEAGETEADWRLRQCKKIAQFRRADARMVSLSEHRIRGSKTSPTAAYEVVYQNNSDSTLRISLSLFTGIDGYPKLGSASYFFPYGANHVTFELAAGQTFPLSGTFASHLPDGTELSLLFRPEEIPLTAEIVPNTYSNPFDLARPASVSGSADAAQFGASIVLFSADAAKGFRRFANCDYPGESFCGSRANFYGANSTHVERKGSGGLVYVTLLEGATKDEALGIFNRDLGWIKSLWPTCAVQADEGAHLPDIAVNLARRLQLHMYVYQDKQSYSVQLTLTAMAF